MTRMALTRATWVTVLCRKLRDWWHWVTGSLSFILILVCCWHITFVTISNVTFSWHLVVGCRRGDTHCCFTRVSNHIWSPQLCEYLFVYYIFLCRYVRAEVGMYHALDPGVRVVILKALCDIRVEVSLVLIVSLLHHCLTACCLTTLALQ